MALARRTSIGTTALANLVIDEDTDAIPHLCSVCHGTRGRLVTCIGGCLRSYHLPDSNQRPSRLHSMLFRPLALQVVLIAGF